MFLYSEDIRHNLEHSYAPEHYAWITFWKLPWNLKGLLITVVAQWFGWRFLARLFPEPPAPAANDESPISEPAPAAKCPYEVLGISEDATLPEVKKAYHKKALIHHPDKNPGDLERASLAMQEITWHEHEHACTRARTNAFVDDQIYTGAAHEYTRGRPAPRLNPASSPDT